VLTPRNQPGVQGPAPRADGPARGLHLRSVPR
jgi:hypothetical protein